LSGTRGCISAVLCDLPSLQANFFAKILSEKMGYDLVQCNDLWTLATRCNAIALGQQGIPAAKESELLVCRLKFI